MAKNEYGTDMEFHWMLVSDIDDAEDVLKIKGEKDYVYLEDSAYTKKVYIAKKNRSRCFFKNFSYTWILW